jgi:ABC-type sugar transport system ATPase subunit
MSASDDMVKSIDRLAGTGHTLRAVGVRKTYGSIVAVAGVDMAIHPREVVAIVGDNGAGKSTLVKMLTGVVTPDRGKLEFCQNEVTFRSPMDARAAGIEAVQQTLGLVESFDVASNIFLGRELTWFRFGSFAPMKIRTMRQEARKRIERTSVNIGDVRQEVSGLSGGQRQGAAIARAVGWGAKLVVFDEPTAALGVRETAQVEEIVSSLRDHDVSSLIVSHNLQQVLRLADHVYVMRQGRVVGSRDVEDLSEELIVAMITGLAADTPETLQPRLS